jgi:formylglycine-generating enzyme required for sulfatase activity
MKTSRRRFLQAGTTLLSLRRLDGWRIRAAEAPPGLPFDPTGNVIPAPADPALWPAFRQALSQWREAAKAKLKYNGVLYDRREFAWSASNYACCFLMTCDEMLYDWRHGRYTVDSFLDHGERDFGGYDSVVLWHAYPRIGVDERNQFDFYRDLPGGLSSLRKVVQQFQHRRVRVYIDYNPWDTGTHREATSDLDALVELVRVLGTDGIFLDTMNRGAAEFRERLDAVHPGTILEGEDAVPQENIHNHHASWAQWFTDSFAPGVLKHKWLERRHMQHQIKRWDYDHTGELHAAWMNGSGIMVWENVFGSWVPWNARDRTILRAMLPIQRRFTKLFNGEGWTPLVSVEQLGVFGSLWEGAGLRLWTLVNRQPSRVSGVLLKVALKPGQRYFDLLTGQEASLKIEGETLLITGVIQPRGIGAFLAGAEQDLGTDFEQFLQRQSHQQERVDFDTSTPRRKTELLAVARTMPRARVPEGMVSIPVADLELSIDMRVRECGFYESTPPTDHNLANSYTFQVQNFRRHVTFKPFAMDETLVTNAQFAQFLKANGYKPKHPENFLRHWVDAKPPAGKEDHPVVWVDLNDARAYASWAGKRLPTEEEWQYAAQGADGWKYPWGGLMEPGRCNGGETGGTTPVKAFPDGQSPFGCYDMCGNVWQWTESQRSDGRTRFCIIRGGGYLAAKGSNWYVDGGPRPANFATKFLLTWPGLDRCSTIGFRCVCDLAYTNALL